jgi:hypothetical protein
MSTREQRIRVGLRTQATVLAMALTTTTGVSAVRAQGAERELNAFGMMSLARDQTLVLSAVITSWPVPRQVVCRMRIGVVNEEGTFFRYRTISLQRGQITHSLHLPANEILREGEASVAIRATVTELPTPAALSEPPDPVPSCDCVAIVTTVQITDPAGRMQTFDSNRDVPPPNPGHCTRRESDRR